MDGDHPWRDWLNVLIIFVGGLIVVMIIVRVMIKWAHKDDRPKGGPGKQPE